MSRKSSVLTGWPLYSGPGRGRYLFFVALIVFMFCMSDGTRSRKRTNGGVSRRSGDLDSSDSDDVLNVSLSGALTCDVARIKCAFRMGCGMALKNYMIGCADLMAGRTSRCSDLCKKSLIALTSTEEGQQLMLCDCVGDEFCELTKRRVEVCRPEVVRATESDAVVSCSVAQWICAADPMCSTALDYYQKLCRSMFHGKKCTLRCNNSISILNRQEKAAKLKTCTCDGTEDYDCQRIKRNMQRLCHVGNPAVPSSQPPPVSENEIQRDESSKASGSLSTITGRPTIQPGKNSRCGGGSSQRGYQQASRSTASSAASHTVILLTLLSTFVAVFRTRICLQDGLR